MKKIITTFVLLSALILSACANTQAKQNTQTADTSPTETTTTTAPEETTIETTVKEKKIDPSDYFADSFLYMAKPNSVGGLQYIWGTKYIGKKTINYFTINFEMYNLVGDPAYNDITGKSKFSHKIVGPIKSGEYLFHGSPEHPTEYSNVCSKLIITSIESEYDDHTTDTIELNISNNDVYDTYIDAFQALINEHPGFYAALESYRNNIDKEIEYCDCQQNIV